MRNAGFLERAVLGIGLTSSLLGGCGAPFGVEPKEGVYEATNSQGVTWEEKVKDGEIWSGYVNMPLKAGNFWYTGSDVVGNGCSNCDCPRDGKNLSGYFTSNEEYNYKITLLEYCTPYAQERINGKWVRELDNSSLTQIGFRKQF